MIAARLPKAEVFVETMNPAVAKRFKERSIEGSHAKFTWGVKDGRALAALLPGFPLCGGAQSDRGHGGVRAGL